MSEWNRVTKANTCPICGKPDWCLFSGPHDSPDAVLCQRTESPKRCGEGGWLHVLRDSGPTWAGWRRTLHLAIDLAVAQPAAAGIEAECAAGVAWLADHPAALERFAGELGVSVGSLRRLSVAYSPQRRAWLFPMRNATGDVCGVRLRLPSGRKLSISGGREGLFVPEGIDHGGLLLVCEGPTDTAALLDLDFAACGRPSCTGGVGLLVDFCKRLHPGRAVVVSDADTPGRKGAAALAQRLRAYVPDVRIIEPPADVKDAREWKAAGATRADVQAVIDAAQPLRLNIESTTHTKGRKRCKTVV